LNEAVVAALKRFALPAAILLVLALGPLIFSDFFLGQILTKALWLGIAAASLTFLAGYGGMISLAQAALYGIAGFTMANLVTSEGGQSLEWNPWVGVAVGIAVATFVGLLLGALASRSEGIYFLMLTLAVGILTYYFFGQVTDLSGFGGLNRIDLPDFLGNPIKAPGALYYTAFVASVVLYVLMRYLVRTPFGLTLQGIRDDSTRMRALGFNVTVHRMLAFTFGAFVASIAGILSVWWNTQISPGSIDLGRAIDILIIAVVGGLFRLEGAWLGAIVFAVIENWSRTKFDFIGANQRFNTVIAGLFLVIVLLSPGGLIGIIERINAVVRGRLGGGSGMSRPPEPSTQESSA
jgi:branched-chain amino acid transport system permease protein